MKYTLIKISDDVFNGNHPNGIVEGYGIVFDNKPEIIIGERYTVANATRYLSTSVVTEIISETEKETIFKTKNSTYKLTTNE